MTDDINTAFDTLEARAIVMQPADPLDRICVRGYTLEVEIGAFQSERGTLQRISFNVVLEVARSSAAASDDVDLILSYDTITEAIHAELAAERLNLLETLAERIADALLMHPSAARVFIRIEKLDRIPGTLGIDVVRSKSFETVNEAPDEKVQGDPLIVFMPNHVLHSADLPAWLDALKAHSRPAIICLESAQEGMPHTDAPQVDRRIGLLSIEQNAWILAAKDARCVVVDSRTELDWAMKNEQLSVWAPSKIVLDAVEKPTSGPNTPLALACWFAKQFSAAQVTVLQGYDLANVKGNISVANTPSEL